MIAPAAAAASLHPFPGLRPFEPDEDHLFFGRERQIDELLRRLRTTRFLAILGTSGCGKSSLVRSGLIPSLYGGAMTRAGSSWRVAILRPGERPMGNLAAALAAPEALGPTDGGDDVAGGLLEAALRANKQGLVQCVRQGRIAAQDNVLVLVDQFEELFRFKHSREGGRDEAVAFVKLLLAAARDAEARIYVALTMRSDFIGDCLEIPGLPEAINEGLYLVPRMSRDELQSAIAGPVAVAGGTIAPRLVSRLLNDVGDDPDQLPILQHALMRTWDFWLDDHASGEPLDLRHYEAVGTMNEALSRHAEEALGELDERGRRLAESLFKALTEKEADGRGIRRPVAVAEARTLTGAGEDELVGVVEPFSRAGRSFLMPPAGVPLRPDSVLDISHESLMRIWGRLGAWVDEEARSAQVYGDLARAAARHEAGTGALWRDPELQIALRWREEQRPTAVWAARYDPSFDRAMRFLDASAAERDREAAERDRQRRAALRRARILVAVFATAAVVMLALGLYVYWQRAQAESAREQAEHAKREAEEALATIREQNLQIEIQAKLAKKLSTRAVQETARAEKGEAEAKRQAGLTEEQRRLAEDQRQLAEAEAVKARVNADKASEAQRDAEAKGAVAEAEKERAQRLARVSFAHALALRPLTDEELEDSGGMGKGAAELNALLALQAYRLNHDNQGPPDDPDIFDALWTARLKLGRLDEVVSEKQPDAVRAVVGGQAGSAAGLLSGSDDGKIRRWSGDRWEVLGSFGSGIRTLLAKRWADSASTPGRPHTLLAAAFADGSVRVWKDAPASSAPRELAAAGASGGGLAFHLVDQLLAAGSANGAIRIWTLEEPGNPPLVLQAAGGRVSAVAFGGTGKDQLLAAALGPGGAQLWKIRGGDEVLAVRVQKPETVCWDRDVKSVAFDPQGKTLACGTGRGEVVLWDVGGRRMASSLLGHASTVNALSFDAQGTSLASASSDGTVRIWDVEHPANRPLVLAGHTSWVWSVAYAKDSEHGESWISAGEDGTVRFWPASSKLLAKAVCALVSRRLTAGEWKRYMPEDLPYDPAGPCPAP